MAATAKPTLVKEKRLAHRANEGSETLVDSLSVLFEFLEASYPDIVPIYEPNDSDSSA